MAGETPLGLGYVELAVKDRGAAAAVAKVQTELRNLQNEAAAAASRIRPAMFGINEAIARTSTTIQAGTINAQRGVQAATAALYAMNQAATSGQAPTKAMAGSLANLATSFLGVGGAVGGVVAMFAAFLGIGITARMRQIAADAEGLAGSLKAVQAAGAAERGLAVASAMSMGAGGDMVMELAKAIDPARAIAEQASAAAAETSWGSDARKEAEKATGRVGDLSVRLGAALSSFRSRMRSEIARAEQEVASASSPDDQVAARQRLLSLTERYREVLAQVALVNDSFVREQLGGDQRLGEVSKMTDLLGDQADSLEIMAAAAKQVAESAREMAEGFESASSAAAASRDELEAAERNAQALRDDRLAKKAASAASVADLTARRDVLALRAGGYDAEADALERRQRFDALRKTASPEERALLDEQERLESILAAGRGSGLTARGGGTTDLLGGLRAFQAGVFGGGESPDERTAKAARETADAAKRSEETEKRMAELLKQIAENTKNGGPATLG